MADVAKPNEGLNGDTGEEEFVEGVPLLDFDMLCSTVALQTQGFSVSKMNVEEHEDGEFGGVQRMWEGEVLDCLEDRRIALETLCCPCYRFGKNMRRAGFGSCFFQGTIYLTLAGIALVNYIFFIVTKRHSFLYLAVAFSVALGTYLGLFRSQIRKQFNIRASDSSVDDCVYHLVCPCCSLCQESRTLEINNVQDGFWSGRGDTICIGRYGEGSNALFKNDQLPLIPTTKSPDLSCMVRATKDIDQSWRVDIDQSMPVLPSRDTMPKR